MKINKKLSTAIVLSLMLGVYGSASATNLYGNSNDLPVISVDFEGNATTIESKATSSNSEFTVMFETWGDVYGGYVNSTEAVKSNTVTVIGGTITGFVSGGKSQDGIAGGESVTDGNKVIITGGTIGAVYGGSSANSNALNNSVEISEKSSATPTQITGNVYGGSSWGYNAIVKDNKVNVTDGTIGAIDAATGYMKGYIYGGWTETGTAIGNKVTISGGTINDLGIYGGYVFKGTGEVKNNTINISNGTINSYSIVAGSGSDSGSTVSDSGSTVDKNIINITGGTFTNLLRVDGGHGDIVTGNEVHIKNVKVTSSINNLYGGYGQTKASDNILVIEDSIIDSNGAFVAGGESKGEANNNEVTIVGENIVLGNVRGGYGYDTANDNKVNISGGTIEQRVYGGWTENGTANDNKVNISGGTINDAIEGGYSKNGVANGNTVSISGKETRVLNSVFGGGSYSSSADSNTVTISGGTIGFAVNGGSGTTGASNNKVIVSGGTINNTVRGGSSSGGNADGNTVTIYGGTIEGQVYAGRVNNSEQAPSDNIVNLGGYEDESGVIHASLGQANVFYDVYGGYVAHDDTKKGTDNTLNVYSVGNSVGSLNNFQNMNFYIPKEANNGDVLVSSTTTYVSDKLDVDLAGVTVKAGFSNETALKTGDKVKLIESENNVVKGMDTESREKVSAGDFVNVDLKIYQGNGAMDQVTSGTATTLVAEIVGEEASESSKSLVETVAVGTAIIAEGGDLLAGAGLANAQAALAIDAEHGAPAGSATLFGAINANKSKIKSGSHVDVKGMNLNLGLVKEIKNNAGKFIVGPVVEYGKGKYDSYLDNGYHGEGDSHFVGGGLVAKQNNNNGMYYEGSVRAGKLMSDYKSNGGNYDSDSTYLAAHLGLGKVVKLNEKNSLDYYGKYFYSHQGSDDTTLHSALDHALHFDGVDSHRTRLGGRLNHVVKENNEVYIGFAWQHEFSSTARATIDGLGTPAPSAKGDTGIMELGWKVSETNKYDVDLGATGSIGKKKGAGINLSFNYKF